MERWAIAAIALWDKGLSVARVSAYPIALLSAHRIAILTDRPIESPNAPAVGQWIAAIVHPSTEIWDAVVIAHPNDRPNDHPNCAQAIQGWAN